MVTTFPGLYHIYKSCIWNIHHACTNRLSAFCLLWVMQRQHTVCTAIQTMPLPALSPCTILPPRSIQGFFPSRCCHCDGSTLTTATQDCRQCQKHLVTLQAEFLVSALKHNRAKSEQSQGDCNNQPKWLSEEEKPYHALCENLKHFGDLRVQL